MAQKYTYEDYSIFVTFISDNCFSIMVNNNLMPQTYSNEHVQLTKIRKDTVIAALQKKNQNNLKCEFKYKDFQGQDHQRLQMSFVVTYDFLPEFRQNVSLKYVIQQETLKRINNITFQSEVTEIQKLLNTLGKSQGVSNYVTSTTTYNDDVTVAMLKVTQGKYLLQMSGFIGSTTGVSNNDSCGFYVLNTDEKKIELPSFKPYINSSYHYPYNISDVIEIPKDGQVIVKCKTGGGGSSLQILNHIAMIQPIVEIA